MKERDFPKLIQNESTETFVLSDKGEQAYDKAKSDILHLMSTIEDFLKNSSLQEGFKDTCCSLMESYVRDYTKSLKYSGELEAEREQRSAEIRSLNIENRELRKQLGEKVSYEDVREKFKNISGIFHKWWNTNGCGYRKDERLGEYGYYCTLSGHISRSYFGEEESPEEVSKRLEEYGFEINNDQGSYQLSSNGSNRWLLDSLLKSRFPSCKILSYEVNNYSGHWVINDIDIQISDLNDFEAK